MSFYYGRLAVYVGKMKQMCRDWLPAQSRWSYLACSGLSVTRPPLFTTNPYNKPFIGQTCLVKMAGHWLFCCCCCFVFVLFFAWLWTSHSARPTNMQKCKKQLGQYCAILTSRFANNPYLCGRLPIRTD